MDNNLLTFPFLLDWGLRNVKKFEDRVKVNTTSQMKYYYGEDHNCNITALLLEDTPPVPDKEIPSSATLCSPLQVSMFLVISFTLFANL